MHSARCSLSFAQMISPLKAYLFVDQDTGEPYLCPISGLGPPRIVFLEIRYINTNQGACPTCLKKTKKQNAPAPFFQNRTMCAVHPSQPQVSHNQLGTGQLMEWWQYCLTLKVGEHENGFCLPGICTLSLILYDWNTTNEKATACCL